MQKLMPNKKVILAIIVAVVVNVQSITALLSQSIPHGAISGHKFTVSSSGNKVLFSRGNLQYISEGFVTIPYWKFADYQWYYLGVYGNGTYNSHGESFDLFLWGTSGYNHGANSYDPTSAYGPNSNYYAYGDYSYNLYDQTGQADWGYNIISNGGNMENQWRTLTKDEWDYVLHLRNTNSGIRFAKAKITNAQVPDGYGVTGVILLPDDWNTSYYNLNNPNEGSASFDSNLMNVMQWFILEQYGAVFLPNACYRSGYTLTGGLGYYWSSTACNNNDAYELRTQDVQTHNAARSLGNSVRLVCQADKASYIINAVSNPVEGGTVNGYGEFQTGTDCTLVAMANTGCRFLYWTENGEIVSSDATYSFMVMSNRSLVANFINSEGINNYGALNGVFSVSDSLRINFSQGNLQYIGSSQTPYWKFAEHQWDYLGINEQGSPDHNANRDLFAWGTSGYKHNEVNYQPWSVDDCCYYAYGSPTNNLNDQDGRADWGYNAIRNGGNTENRWRTLTNDEWHYLFNTRNTISGWRFVKAKVNNVTGVVLLPDDWNTSYYDLNNPNDGSASFNSNIINVTQWIVLEQHGAVFLPSAGYRSTRYGSNTATVLYGINTWGYYWSASYYDTHQFNYADCVYFHDSYLATINLNQIRRDKGASVRLVCDANSHFSINDIYVDIFFIYPNPAVEIIVVESAQPINRCEIYSIVGSLVYKTDDCSDKFEINVANLPSGAYIIKIDFDGLTQNRVFIKK